MKSAQQTESDPTEPAYRCESCGREFPTQEALDDHINSVGLVY